MGEETMTTAAARTKGPIVFGDMDQQALDDAYDQAKWAANQVYITDRRAAFSAEALKHIAPPCRKIAIGAFGLPHL